LYQAAKKAAVDLHQQEKDVFGRLKSARNEVQIFEKKIEDEKKLLGESSGPARRKLEEELEEAKKKEEELQGQQTETTKSGSRLASITADAEKKLSDITREEDLKRADLTAAESRLRVLQSRTSSRFEGFEPNMAELVRRIENDNGFEEKPVGPLGAHIQLLQPAWSSIIESFLGSTLNGFLVMNKRDHQRLSTLMQQAGVRSSPIIIGKRLPPNTVLREPDEQFKSILRVLKFENDWVRDQLIINQTIEKVILVEERTKGEAIISDGNAPRNVSLCLCFHDKKRGEGLRLSRKEDGSMSASPIQEYKRSSRMKSDNETRIALQREVLSQMQAELHEIGSQKRIRQQMLKKCQLDQKAQRDRAGQLEQQLLMVQATIEKIETSLDQFEYHLNIFVI
jgi:chromosome segregation ATPase